MPLVRIGISKTASRERVPDVGNAVYNAIIAVANVPANDRFQVITRHDPNEIIYPEQGYLGIDYLSAHHRRNSRLAGCAQAGHLDQPGRFRPREDWSFGNGEMQ
jgi:hypothetical protein